MKISAKPIASRSSTEPVRIADRTPSGIPIASQMITAPTVRKIVAGSRLRISGSTSVLFWNENPK